MIASTPRPIPVSRPETVGGSIEIAAIAKHEGFKWIERRHFFPPEHNASG